ncbi:MAG: translation initiation factor IF-2 [Clostridia bacterium]|nr:translation initiation factor IF-2 [Clostridia bacterium]
MAKKIQEITKELSQKSVQLYTDITKVKTSAEKLLADLKKIENGFAKKEEAEIAEQKLRAIQSQSKAWTMPDDVPESKPKTEDKKPEPVDEKPKADVKPIASEEQPRQEKKAEPAPAPVTASEPAGQDLAEQGKQPVAPEADKAQQQSQQASTAAAPRQGQQTQAAPAQRQSQQAQTVTAPRQGQQGQAAAAPRQGQQGQTVTAPRQGQQSQTAAAPRQGQQGQNGYAPRQGQQGQNGYAPRQGQQGQGGYAPRQGQQGQNGYVPRQGQQGQNGYALRQGQQGQGFGPRQGQQGQGYGPRQGQQGQGFGPRQGQQGQGFGPRQGQQGQGYGPRQGQQGQGVGPRQGQGTMGGGAQNRPAGARMKPKAAEPDIIPSMEKERVSNYDPNKKMRQRQHDPEHQNAKNRKQLARESGYSDMDDEVVRGRRKKQGKQDKQQKMAPIKIETAFMTAETITVRDLTERIGKPAGEIIKKLMLLGIMATINQELDFDTASLVASEFGVTLEMKLDKTAEDALSAENVEDDEADLRPRPPVITVMGHVDHGKTSLLDYIRKTRVTEGEAGGITQHIGAYVAQVNGRQITFLDTPGHEAFTAMRARGTQATDIAILVVAADDGVMPQTIESIHHAKAAKCPVIVAINKIDKPGADPDVVKQELTQYELIPEEWGGDTIMVPVSAKTGEGIDDLLENVLLLADMLELKANPNRKARGVIVEAKLDHARGAIATALVQNGTLNVGDMVVAGGAYGRVRAMVSSRGDRVKSALPATPVEIVGFGSVPDAGDEFIAVEDEKLARQVVEERAAKARASMAKSSSASTLEELYSKLAEGEVKDLNIIIKADVQGSVEAVKQSLEKLSNDKVHVKTIHCGVGGVTENDVMLAGIDGAIIIGFNVRPDGKAREAAQRDGIDIRYYRIIYQAIEDIEKAMKGLLTPEFKENLLGHAEVRNVFKITGVGTIAGCYVIDGKIQRNAQVRLLRDNVVIFEGKLSSLQRFKDSVREVAEGYECGVGLENYADIKNGDVVECFLMEEISAD